MKNSAKKAAEAGNQEPSIDTDTGHDAQNNEDKFVAAEEPVQDT